MPSRLFDAIDEALIVCLRFDSTLVRIRGFPHIGGDAKKEDIGIWDVSSTGEHGAS